MSYYPKKSIYVILWNGNKKDMQMPLVEAIFHSKSNGKFTFPILVRILKNN